MKAKVLITGASGFIGSHLVEMLVRDNWEVACLVRPTSRTAFLRKFPVRFFVGREDDQCTLEKAVDGKDYVFHLAGRIRAASRRVYDASNHRLTRNLIQACLRKNKSLKRFVYVSSIAAAGPSSPGLSSDENRTPSPTSEYGRSKLRAEDAVREVWSSIPATIIRPPNVYGPRQLETELLVKLIRKRIVPILRENKKMTSLIYVKDLTRGIIQAALSPKTEGQVYYLTDGQGYSWREIILTVKRFVLGSSLFFPFPEELVIFAAFLIDILNSTGLVKIFFGRKLWQAMVQTPWLFSSAKAEKDFGFHARFSLEEGIRETVECYFLG
jgi:nucleoside-diphosphate-sugar epimerase